MNFSCHALLQILVESTVSEYTELELEAFLDQAGLPADDLEALPLEAAEHDLGDYAVIVSLSGTHADYIERMPFHSSALDWRLDEAELDGLYRELQVQVSDLVDLVAGPQGARG